MSDNPVVPDIFPPKVWKFVKIVLGIRSHKDDRPITSTVLHVLTFSSALGKLCSKTISLLTLFYSKPYSQQT